MMECPMFGKKFNSLDAETEADARAEFVIYLIEQGIVNQLELKGR